MTRERTEQVVFLAAGALALVTYALTVPHGLPWNDSVHRALDHSGPFFWWYFCEIFGRHPVALSCTAGALAAGFLGVSFLRFYGFGAAIAASLVWIYAPPIWQAAITGSSVVFYVAIILTIFTYLQGLSMRIFCRRVLPRYVFSANLGSAFLPVAAVILSAISIVHHDGRIGEAAGVFARGVLKSADGKPVVLSGVCDEQLRYEAGADEKKVYDAAQSEKDLLRGESPESHPDRFFFIDGRSTTMEEWQRRWNEFKPYLTSDDPFVPVAKRQFAREGNALAKRIFDEAQGATGDRKAELERNAWDIYLNLIDSVDADNISALLNMREMIRRGHAAKAEDKARVDYGLECFVKNAEKRRNAQQHVGEAGVTLVRDEELPRAVAEATQRLVDKIASGEEPTIPDGLKSLVEWNDELNAHLRKEDFTRAANVARAILGQANWHGYLPAYAALGRAANHDGEYAASERFFRKVVRTTSIVSPDDGTAFADTLLRLGQLDEAETWVRKVIDETKADHWMSRAKLVEILKDRASRMEKSNERTEVITEAVGRVRELERSVPKKVLPKIRALAKEVSEL